MRMDWTERVVWLLVLVFAASILWLGVAENAAQNACLAHGWPRSDWHPIAPTYCIKRINQTDSVVSLDALRHK